MDAFPQGMEECKKIPAAGLAGCLLFLPRLFQLQNLGQNVKLEKWSCELSSLGLGNLNDDQTWDVSHAIYEWQGQHKLAIKNRGVTFVQLDR